MVSGKRSALQLTLLLFLVLTLWFAAVTGATTDQEQEIRRNIEIFTNPSLSFGDRQDAVDRLVKIGRPAVPALLQTLKDEKPEVQSGTAYALAQMGPEIVPALIQALRDEKPEVRSGAAYALTHMGPAAQDAVPALSQALRDEKPEVRSAAAFALGAIGPAAQDAVPALIQALRNEKPEVLSGVAYALGAIGPAAKDAVPALSQALRDEKPEVRSAAASALGQIGLAAIPALSQALKDEKPEVRSNAASALGAIGPAAKDAVPALIQALRDEKPEVCSYAAYALGAIGPAAKDAVPGLIQALRDGKPEVRSAAAYALGAIGPAAKDAVPALILALKDEKPGGRSYAASALGSIGPAAKDAVPALIQALRDEKPEVRFYAVYALGGIGPAAREALPALIKALGDKETIFLNSMQDSAVEVLGKFGPTAQEAVPAIVAAFRGVDIAKRSVAAQALLKIVAPGENLDRTAWQQKISQLKNLRETFFKDFNEPPGKDLRDQLDLMIRALQAETPPSVVVDWVKQLLQDKWWALALAGYMALLLMALPTWLLLFWLQPLWLFGLNENISVLDIKIPYFDQPVGLRQLLLLSGFHYCPRVLDAWVQAHLGRARASFAALKTVSDRAVHVPVPVILNGHAMAQPAPGDFHDVFQKAPFCLLIWGEGGSGKTSLACQLAEWALVGDSASSLGKHHMLPVLIEHDLKIEASAGGPPLLEAIHKQVVERLTGGQEVSPDLLRSLLRRQRLLVIVDHFSELRPETRQSIQPGYNPQLTINAMIVTSRQEEKFQGSVTDTLKPLRIRGNRLSSFMEAYLTQLGKRELYDDAEFFAACGRLTEMVGDRNLTVLLARLFADQMIATKEEPAFEDLPDNIPDLMLSYLNWINRHVSEKTPDNKVVQRIVKAISWVCLEPTFRPTDANMAAIHAALATEPDLDQKLDYLCCELGIIQCVGPAEDKVRVSLDPLAEYLAGLRLLELYGANELQWQAFLLKADNKEGAPKTIEGFLLALRDCCLAKGKDYGVPEFVEQGLARKTSITRETSKAEAA